MSVKRINYAGLFDNALSTELNDWFVPEVFSSLLVMLVIIILSLVIYFKFKKANKDPMQEQKGFVLVISTLVGTLENFVVGTMGEKNKKYSGLVMGIAMYIFFCFLIGLTGLASPMTYLGCTVSVALITFGMIHFTAIQENHWKYFKRYIDPIPVFLPINLISMWAPLLSMSLRLFGNAVSGFCIMSITYFGLKSLSASVFGGVFAGAYVGNTLGQTFSGANGPAGMFFAPFVTPVLHLYFDLFSGFIQTFVFLLLTMIFILQEKSDEDESSVINRETQNA